MHLPYTSLAYILVTVIITTNAEQNNINVKEQSSTIKGVSPQDQYKYQPDSNGYFTCLNDSSIKIPISKINDDYCDCPDGSDEPGTSACFNSRFYCNNKGFKSGYLPGFKVNDGKCDYEICCDGSDEADGLCPDKCVEFAEQYKLNKQFQIKNLKNGLKLKNKIFIKANDVKFKLNAEKEKYIENLNELETELVKLEKISSEKNQIINNLFSNVENKVNELNQSINDKVKLITDQLNKLNGLENALKSLSNDYNPNFNDPAVKAAVSSYRDFEANNEGDFLNNGASELLILSNKITEINNELEGLKKKVGELSNGSGSGNGSSYIESPSFFKQFINQVINSFLGIESKQVKVDNVNESSDVSKFVGDDSTTENRIKELQKQIKNMKKDLSDREEDLNKSFGPDDILRGLQGTCILDSISGYDYKVCFTDKLEQVGKDGRSTKIGSFDNCEIQNDGVLNIQFNRGEKCWNGPIRKGDVTVLCGSENKILSVSEPEKCEYHFVVTSPIGCFQEDLDKLQNDN